MEDQRTKILQRILNLRAKMNDDGASEAEMNSAFLKAQKMMESYEVEEAELALAEGMGTIKLDLIKYTSSASALKGKRQLHKIVFVINAIGKFASVKAVYFKYTGKIVYFGHRSDVELADYMTVVIRNALDNEYQNYLNTAAAAVGYGAKAAFQTAMAYRIVDRLRIMSEEMNFTREERVNESVKKIENPDLRLSRALVIKGVIEAKKIAVNDYFNKNAGHVRTVNLHSHVKNSNAFKSGSIAGDSVGLHKAVNSSSQKAITNA